MSSGNTESSWYISQLSPWCSYSNYVARRFCSLFLALFRSLSHICICINPLTESAAFTSTPALSNILTRCSFCFVFETCVVWGKSKTVKQSISIWSQVYLLFFQKEAWSLEMSDWCRNKNLFFTSYSHSKIRAPSVVHIQPCFNKAIESPGLKHCHEKCAQGKDTGFFLLPCRLTMSRYPISITGMRIMMST